MSFTYKLETLFQRINDYYNSLSLALKVFFYTIKACLQHEILQLGLLLRTLLNH